MCSSDLNDYAKIYAQSIEDIVEESEEVKKKAVGERNKEKDRKSVV